MSAQSVSFQGQCGQNMSCSPEKAAGTKTSSPSPTVTLTKLPKPESAAPRTQPVKKAAADYGRLKKMLEGHPLNGGKKIPSPQQNRQSILQQIFGSDFALGAEVVAVPGELVGKKAGRAYGVGGLGLLRPGQGNENTGEGTLGLGDLGTLGGKKDNPSTAEGYGRGAGGLGGRLTTDLGEGTLGLGSLKSAGKDSKDKDQAYNRGAGGLGGRRASSPEVIPPPSLSGPQSSKK